MPDAFGEGGLNFPVTFLEDDWGIPVAPNLLKRGETQAHDPRDLILAQEVAAQVSPAPMGLLYQNTDLPTYEEVRFSGRKQPSKEAFRQRLEGVLDEYAVGEPKNIPEVPIEPESETPVWVPRRPKRPEREAPIGAAAKLSKRLLDEKLETCRRETQEETVRRIVGALMDTDT